MTTKPEGPAQEPHNHANLAEILMCEKCCAPSVVAVLAAHGRIVVPATPTPSQPAGAREWLPKQPIINYLLEMYNGRFAKDIVAAMEGYARQQTAAKDAEIEQLEAGAREWTLPEINGLALSAVVHSPFYNAVEKQLAQALIDATQQTAASELKGWQDAINSVRASLQQYPDGGGDVEIMLAVEAIVKAQTAAKDADNKRLMFAMRDAERERDSLREWIRECLFIAEGGKPTDESFTLGVIVAKLQEADAALKAGKDGTDVTRVP